MWRNGPVPIDPLPLTGERTVPGIDREQYWFARHEVVYRWVTQHVMQPRAGAVVLDAGCGEGYGAELLDGPRSTVVALDYDEITIGHVGRRYPRLCAVRGNLDSLPLRDEAADLVVSLQVIEHLWDLPRFLRECRRVLRPGGSLVVSTPNRPVFSPGLGRGEPPTNPFHVEEFDAEQVANVLSDAGFAPVEVHGLHHGRRLREWEAENGSIVAAQVSAVLGDGWTEALEAAVSGVTARDFVIGGAWDAQDLVGVGVR